jgi:hypothetical protein
MDRNQKLIERITFLLVVILHFALGCHRPPTFTDVGGGRALPSESIDEMARERGISRQEAIRVLRDEASPAKANP